MPPRPTYANNSQYSPLASSSYHGLHLSLVQRPVAWGQYRITYTLSKAMDNVGAAWTGARIDDRDDLLARVKKVFESVEQPDEAAGITPDDVVETVLLATKNAR